MSFIKLEGVGQDFCFVNSEQITFLREGKYGGVEIHFDKGSSVLVSGSIDTVASVLSGVPVQTVEEVADTQEDVQVPPCLEGEDLTGLTSETDVPQNNDEPVDKVEETPEMGVVKVSEEVNSDGTEEK